MANFGNYMAMQSTITVVKLMIDKKYKKKTIKLFLKKAKDEKGITMLNFKKTWKQKYGTEFQLRESKKGS